MIVSIHWRTYSCRIESAMTLDTESPTTLIAREIGFDEIESYLVGQKSLRQIISLLVSKYLIG